MKRTVVLACASYLAACSLWAPGSARGDAFSIGVRMDSVSLGIQMGDPPSMVVVPGTPVYHAPSVAYNYFYYHWQYYLYHKGAWFVAMHYNGPWTVIALEHVPEPILTVPVAYYKVPPSNWKKKGGPPPWVSAKSLGKKHQHREDGD